MVVIEVREKQYSSRRKESKQRGGRGGFRGREDPVQDRGGRGREIGKEVPACPACAAKQHEAKTIEIPTPPAPEVNEETAASPEQASANASVETKANTEANAPTE